MHVSDRIYYHPSALFSFYPATPSILMEMQKKRKRKTTTECTKHTLQTSTVTGSICKDTAVEAIVLARNNARNEPHPKSRLRR